MTADDRRLRWVRAGVLILVVIGVVARFDGLGTRVFWHDETHTGCAIAGSSMREIMNDVFDGRAHPREDFLIHQFPRDGKTISHTLRTLARDDPRQVPLYFVLVRSWALLFGSSIEVLRSFSAALGVISLPLVFLLSRELFERRLEAWLAVGLLAVSPLHVAYSQEARQYVLWVDLVLLASWLLLLALRRANNERRAGGWFALYGGVIGLSLFAHLLTVLVMSAHLVFIAVARRHRPVAAVWMTVGAQAVVAAAFFPWARHIIAEAETRPWIPWAATDLGVSEWLRRIGGAYARIFFDSGEGSRLNITHAPAVLVLLAAVFCLVLLVRSAPPRARLLVLVVGSICSLPMISVDLWAGGVRTLVTRYQFPAVLALELGVAFGIAHLLRGRTPQRRWLGAAVAAVLAGSGIVSVLRSEPPAASSGRDTRAAADFVESSSPSLVVSSRDNRADIGKILSFAHTAGPNTLILAVVEPTLPEIPESSKPVFLWRTSKQLRRQLTHTGWRLERTEVPELDHLIRPDDSPPTGRGEAVRSNADLRSKGT